MSAREKHRNSNEQMKFFGSIMDDIWKNSEGYNLSYACLSGEHNKCKIICECKCHKEIK